MDSKRLSEIEADIALAEAKAAGAEDRYLREVGAGRATKAVHDHYEIIAKGRSAGLEILRAKRVNVAAGLPEDHGLVAPLDIERMATAMLDKFKSDLIDAVAYLYAGVRRDFDAFTAEVRKDLGEMKQAAGLRYRGVFQPAEDYGRGDFVTHAGSLWHANQDTRAVPGKSTEWQLAVKSPVSR